MSNAVTAPVPVTTQTCLPSVTGEGEELFCLLKSWFPSSSSRAQSCFPSLRERQIRSSFGPPGSRPPPYPPRRRGLESGAAADGAPASVGEVTKTWSPQMMGVPALHEGSGAFQMMFSVRLHVVGRLVARLILFPFRPRHCGQFSCAWDAAQDRRQRRAIASRTLRRFMRFPPAFFSCHLLPGRLRDGDQMSLRAEKERPRGDRRCCHTDLP